MKTAKRETKTKIGTTLGKISHRGKEDHGKNLMRKSLRRQR
jgi:hypothetical protein